MTSEELFLNFSNLKEIKLQRNSEEYYREVNSSTLSISLAGSIFSVSCELIFPLGGYNINSNFYYGFEDAKDFNLNVEKIMAFNFENVHQNEKIKRFLSNLDSSVKVLKNTLNIIDASLYAKIVFDVNEKNTIYKKDLFIELFINKKYSLDISFFEKENESEIVKFLVKSTKYKNKNFEQSFTSEFDKDILTKFIAYQAMIDSEIELEDIDIDSAKKYIEIAEMIDY